MATRTTWEQRRAVYDRVMTVGMAEAMEVCSRPSFGQPKPVRITLVNGIVMDAAPLNALQVVQQMRDPSIPAHLRLAKVEKLWPEIGWETVWEDGEWRR